MSILACISLAIVDSLVIVDNLPLTDESTITRGDCIYKYTFIKIRKKYIFYTYGRIAFCLHWVTETIQISSYSKYVIFDLFCIFLRIFDCELVVLWLRKVFVGSNQYFLRFLSSLIKKIYHILSIANILPHTF